METEIVVFFNCRMFRLWYGEWLQGVQLRPTKRERTTR